MSSGVPKYTDIIDPNSFHSHRKPIIQRLEKKLNSRLIVYTASPFHPLPEITIQDIPLFEELLRSVAGADVGSLMITSPGGDANVAEKLLLMCRERFSKGFNVIVPDFAKSAATMIALGSDKILMGYLAELGPIDPQLRTAPLGEVIPARSFIDGLEIIRKKVTEDHDPVQMYFPMLSQIRPEILASCYAAIDGARKLAEKWLKRYMLKDDPDQAEKVAKWLSEGVMYKSHGKVIDFDEARNVLKLNVEKIDPDSDLWTDIWELYCRSIHWLQQHQGQGAAKLFESESVSLVMNLQVRFEARLPPAGPPAPPLTPPTKQPPTPPKGIPPPTSEELMRKPAPRKTNLH
jgi:hypothetical protein